ILQIFARRAKSAEAQIQVELAQLQYLISRIPVSERQQRFKGGIGMRGPGESPLQLRNEPMRRRIRELERKLERIRERRRRTRQRRPWPLVCLVGYTNAGKSTLLQALTGAETFVDDRLFATLDTKSCLMRLRDGRQVMVTDTVGFIRNLPHTLVASFHSTLEEAVEADLLLVVADAAHPCAVEHLAVVRRTLDEIGAGRVPSILVLNKCDLPEAPPAVELFARTHPGAIAISARTGAGIDLLKAEIGSRLLSARGDHAFPSRDTNWQS
ncbi:MAG: GTPase HflX, partial [Kiritimatiellae bacterium]|nr:GTPase HflX [Kiritimatiellia bacterium]